MPNLETRQVVFRAATIAGTSEVLRFAYYPDSDFSEIWGDHAPANPASLQTHGSASSAKHKRSEKILVP